jgi:hypothetical protein
MQAGEQKQLVSLLDELSGAVEELLLAGLTAASKSTVERIDVTFKEASRMRLLRLGSTLRLANEEISRFTAGASQFSSRRLAFFLSRAWVLATSMKQAIQRGDQAALDRLLSTPSAVPVDKLRVVTLGVSKRVVPGAFASFDFRLRAIEPSGPIEAGEALIWSCVFPMRKDLELPAEAFLHLPQKQNFKPSMLLEKSMVDISRCAMTRQPGSATRLSLSEATEVKASGPFDQWQQFCCWDLRQASARLQQHRPTPVDLEIELQEEVFLDEWTAGPSKSTDDGYDVLPIEAVSLSFEARLDRGPSGVPLRDVVTKLAAKKQRPPLYGVVHYESCRLIFQPLAALGKDGPEYLTVSPEKISQAALVKAMKFT